MFQLQLPTRDFRMCLVTCTKLYIYKDHFGRRGSTNFLEPYYYYSSLFVENYLKWYVHPKSRTRHERKERARTMELLFANCKFARIIFVNLVHWPLEFDPLATTPSVPKKHVYKIQNLSQTRQQAILSYLESTCAKYE